MKTISLAVEPLAQLVLLGHSLFILTDPEILELLEKATGEQDSTSKEVLPQLNGDVLVSVGLNSDADV